MRSRVSVMFVSSTAVASLDEAPICIRPKNTSLAMEAEVTAEAERAVEANQVCACLPVNPSVVGTLVTFWCPATSRVPPRSDPEQSAEINIQNMMGPRTPKKSSHPQMGQRIHLCL